MNMHIILEGNREVWRGTEEDLSRSPFPQLRIDDNNWIFKAVNTMSGNLHKPLALDLINKGLRLNCTTGFKQAIICLKGKPLKPLQLEGAVPPLVDFLEKHMGRKTGVIFDIVENRGVTAAVSLSDIHFAKEFSLLGSISDDAVQRLALLIILSRCGTINNDDILVRNASKGDLELVCGDAKKVGWYHWKSHASVWDIETRQKRRSGPLDEMKLVLDRMSHTMTESDQYDDERHQNADNRFENTRVWHRWESRPMADTVAELVSSWTIHEIDAALNAWESAVKATRKLYSNITGMDYSSKPCEDWPADCKKHYKKQIEDLQEKVRKGERPSLSEINLAFVQPMEDN